MRYRCRCTEPDVESRILAEAVADNNRQDHVGGDVILYPLSPGPPGDQSCGTGRQDASDQPLVPLAGIQGAWILHHGQGPAPAIARRQKSSIPVAMASSLKSKEDW